MLGLSVSRWVKAHDGTRLHAVVTRPGGDRPPRGAVVLIHGFTMATPFWDHQVRDLGQDQLVIAYDQRGHGRSGPARNAGFSLDALGADLDAVVRTLVPEGLPTVACGHSMGGMAIMGWAAHTKDAPQDRRIDAAVLTNTTAHSVGHGIIEAFPPWLTGPIIGGLIPALSLPVPIGGPLTPALRFGARVMAFGPGASEGDRALTEHLLRSTHPVARSKAMRFLRHLDARPALEHLTIPTTVIIGEWDRLTPPSRGREIADQLDARLVVLPRCGHQGPMEVPRTLIREIRSALDVVS